MHYLCYRRLQDHGCIGNRRRGLNFQRSVPDTVNSQTVPPAVDGQGQPVRTGVHPVNSGLDWHSNQPLDDHGETLCDDAIRCWTCDRLMPKM